MSLESDMSNYNKVKAIVVGRICSEGYMTQDEGNEFIERNQVLVYKGNWFSKWFEKNVSIEKGDKEKYYIRVISMSDKDPDLEDSAMRNRRLKAGVYRNVFKKLLTKTFSEIMNKKELDFNEVVFYYTDDELLDCMNIIFKDQEMMDKYKKDYQNFLNEANDIAKTIGFKNGTQLTIED